MNFEPFDNTELEQYKEEAKAKWGETAAYQEYAQNAKKGASFAQAGPAMMQLFTEIGALQHLAPTDEAVQKKVAALQQFITDNFYTCTNEILYGLGQMYVADERFMQNIDKAGGPGTAQFASNAIAHYCGK